MLVSEAAAALDAGYGGADVTFRGCSTDSRSLERDQLFVALVGPTHDGHEHVGEAQARGAAAALVSRAVDASVPVIRVADTLEALGRLSGVWRERFELPVIGVTGSNGKTTVKEMLAGVNLESVSMKKIRVDLEEKFGVPLNDKKSIIKEFAEKYIS